MNTVLGTLTAMIAAFFLGAPFLVAGDASFPAKPVTSGSGVVAPQNGDAKGKKRNRKRRRLKAPFRIKAEGKPIKTFRNGAAVCDFNGDGLKDLVFGVGAGIQVALNKGTKEAPEYDKPTPIQIQGKTDVVRVTPGIGCNVQVVDFDHDGTPDILAGPVQPYLFKRAATGEFTRTRLVTGPKFGVGRLTSFYATDWDKDGDFDIIHGNLNGRVILVRNVGTQETPNFSSDYETIRSGGETLLMVGGTSTPIHVDWDGDGKRDLIVGSANGEVSWFRNIGSDSDPRFDKPRQLISKAQGFLPNDPVGPGKVSIPSVADYDGDGLLDLVVGDQLSELPRPEGFPKEKLERYRKLLSEYERIGEAQSLALEAFRIRVREIKMDSPQFRNAFQQLRVQIQGIDGIDTWRELSRELTAMAGELRSEGRLWIYLSEASE